MSSNLDEYKTDLDSLIEQGNQLRKAMSYECDKSKHDEQAKEDKELAKIIASLPKFNDVYQTWYSEAQAVIKQLLPGRLEDFVRHYQKPKPRKDIDFENYRIEDYLQGLTVTRGFEKTKVVGTDAAIPHFEQQQAILNAVSARFESTLFDIKQLVQADLFDSEIDAARSLLKHGFLRGAGAISGVILEKHLAQVAQNHDIKTRKKNPTINDFNELLKNGGIIDVPPWRQIQRLGDIRNLCDHNKDRDPTKDEVEELIDGVDKFTKTLY